MPQGSGDGKLRAKLRAFADAIDKLELVDELADLGQEETAQSLRDMADDFEDCEGDQGTARAGRVGATMVIPTLLKP